MPTPARALRGLISWTSAFQVCPSSFILSSRHATDADDLITPDMLDSCIWCVITLYFSISTWWVEDHALGLSTFTIMAGLGGSLGYAMGGINWDNTFIGKDLIITSFALNVFRDQWNKITHTLYRRNIRETVLWWLQPCVTFFLWSWTQQTSMTIFIYAKKNEKCWPIPKSLEIPFPHRPRYFTAIPFMHIERNRRYVDNLNI